MSRIEMSVFEWNFGTHSSPPTGSPVELTLSDDDDYSYNFTSGRSNVAALTFFALPHFREVRLVAESVSTGSTFSLVTHRVGAVNLEGSGEYDLAVEVVDFAVADATVHVKAADKLSIDGCFSGEVQAMAKTSLDVASRLELESQLGADFDVEETDSGLRMGSDRFGDCAVSFDVGREARTLVAAVVAIDFDARIALSGVRAVECSSTGTESRFVFRLFGGGMMGVYLDSSIRVELVSATT